MTTNIDIDAAENYIDEIWATMIQEDLHKHLVLHPLLDHKYEPLVKAHGDRVLVPTFSELTTAQTSTRSQPASGGEWSDTSGITFHDHTSAQTAIEVDTRSYVAMLVDDPVRIQTYLPIMQQYTGEMGRLLGEVLDTAGFTNLDTTTNTDGALAVAITEDDVLKAKETLDANKAMPNDRVFVVSAETYVDMLGIERFTNSLYNQSLSNLDGSKGFGFKGSILDFDIYMTHNTPSSGGGHKNFMFQKEASAVIVQDGVAFSRREPYDQFATAIRAIVYYGHKLMRDAAAYELSGR